jgi:hypothetical protein
MHKILGAIAGLTLLSSSAFASGGLSCEVADANLKLTAESGVTHGMGGPFFNFKASAEILNAAVHPDLKALILDDKLVHHWLDGKTLKLSFYQETAEDKPHAYVDITIDTQSDEEGNYNGAYQLSIFAAEPPAGAENPVELSGTVTCFVE